MRFLFIGITAYMIYIFWCKRPHKLVIFLIINRVINNKLTHFLIGCFI